MAAPLLSHHGVLLQLLGVANGHGGDVVGGLLKGTCLEKLLPEGAQK
jgi:hypothetical protein